MNRLIIEDRSSEGQEPSGSCSSPATVEAKIPSPCREFCARNDIDREVMQTVDLARKHFAFHGQPSFQIVDDPECEENYLAIHVDVSGDTDSVFEQSEKFLGAFVTSIDSTKQRFISLVYHS